MGSCAAPSAKGDDKFITTDYLQQCRLYWMTPLTRWKLLEELSSWTISFENDSPECLYEFERLLNDYALREKLQHKTGALRDSIVHKVLRSVDERLS
ncbi:His-Xaa-Ser system protein HxsD [Klebsiella pneumoniae subsp. pneumoniae]|nr:His-Xaa-Ser system protein HxsD [Klebsiella pneumoniae subsp. pneumoniae]